MVFGKEVTLQTHGLDKYGRTLAGVILPDGMNVNHTLVQDGWCWCYRKYAPSNAELERLETEARTQRRGVWDADEPMPPWEWRAQRRNAVTVTDFGRDNYHRLLGDVVLPDGRLLNRELVREGFCWWYRKYAPENGELERLETEAQEAKKGLWADPQPVPPWEWRKRR